MLVGLLRPLLAVCGLVQLRVATALHYNHNNGFYYHDVGDGNSNGEIYFNGVRLYVESPQSSVSATRGSSVTLPCHFHYEPELSAPRRTRVKWSWLPANGAPAHPVPSSAFASETEVMVAMGNRHRSYGGFRGRVRLRRSAPGDLSLVINELRLNDTGRYRCEVIDGLEDESVTVELEMRGVVFPYYSNKGRYRLNFLAAQQACQDQDATLATFEQLFTAWEEGLDWCNAGWLADGTVQYPITAPRAGCGGLDLAPGVRSYGLRHRLLHRFDAFCFSASIKGTVYFLQHPTKLNFTEAVRACGENSSHIAKVGQLYAAWRLAGLDRCDAGWLADGSVRYPIVKARANCGPPEPGVRSFGFPPRQQKFGVYCYR
ncbi:hyaluronan and proteoglycan link protein 3 [Corythoichthys intestinalis]|uniref:hyaluronan and proteoglycan link protein 3 n=1 Tax=Corythoichthys intestinalis TaxID=161448 RepID=UPI0025A5C8D1|nr:hyaluronan and proteoglycan link protein 3 [Corythoichthys intestinalis]XP_057691683.1 hyaluronan and proteoglycan link protein 3 [Corythoichthys intestinalis]XP_061812731.1 hyaluronan and proteoglycan link protein 3-like [Nerophis lumbriciformis]